MTTKATDYVKKEPPNPANQLRNVLKDCFIALSKAEMLVGEDHTKSPDLPHLVAQLQAVRIARTLLIEAFPYEDEPPE